VDRRIYPEFRIHAQASGRWSIVNPPLQQFPKDLEDLIIPDEGEAWIEWDWKQAEPRFLAYLSGDEPMMAAFSNGVDPYTIYARDLSGLDPPPKMYRDFAKRYILKLSYGGLPASDTSGAMALGLDKHQLVQMAARFFAAHPAVAQYWRQIDASIRTGASGEAFVVSRAYDGRRRMICGSREAVKREAKNHPMQGSVSGLLNTTCIEVKHVLPYASLVKTKHDSGTFAVPVEKVDEALPAVRQVVERIVEVNGFKARFPAEYTIIHADGSRRSV